MTPPFRIFCWLLALSLGVYACTTQAAVGTVSENPWQLVVSNTIQPGSYATFAECDAARVAKGIEIGANRTSGELWIKCQKPNRYTFVAPTPVDCAVSEWSVWSACESGTQSHTRTIVTQPANGGAACPALEESVPCVPPSSGEWVNFDPICRENETCMLPSGEYKLRFGSSGAYSTNEPVRSGSFVCQWGDMWLPEDPSPGNSKVCQYFSGNATPPPPTDTDGDGVPDSTDECDTQVGPASNNGCPLPPTDTDGDGVPDSTDQCDTQPGPASNSGCPVQQGGNWPQPPMPGLPLVNEQLLVTLNEGRSGYSIGQSGESIGVGAGEFRTECAVSHMNFDDPLLFPGAANAGRSHHHTFFGNTSTWAGTDLNTIRTQGKSTCDGGEANKSAYWVPSVIDTRTGKAIRPIDTFGVYYKTGFSNNPQAIQPMPVGLKLLAGTPMATSEPSGGHTGSPMWHCHYNGPSGPTMTGVTIPDCPYTNTGHPEWEPWVSVHGTIVWGLIDFPQCWDGVNLDSPNHRDHMSYKWANNGNCPASHPVEIPSITFNLKLHVRPDDDPAFWRLSSDAPGTPAGWSFHGDWINGWDPAIVDAWLNNCLRAVRDCHTNNLGDGRRLQ